VCVRGINSVDMGVPTTVITIGPNPLAPLVCNFIYDESVNRAISVDVRGMTEVLRKVFGANELADELPK